MHSKEACPALYWLHKPMLARGRLSKISKDVKNQIPIAPKAETCNPYLPAYFLVLHIKISEH